MSWTGWSSPRDAVVIVADDFMAVRIIREDGAPEWQVAVWDSGGLTQLTPVQADNFAIDRDLAVRASGG